MSTAIEFSPQFIEEITIHLVGKEYNTFGTLREGPAIKHIEDWQGGLREEWNSLWENSVESIKHLEKFYDYSKRETEEALLIQKVKRNIYKKVVTDMAILAVKIILRQEEDPTRVSWVMSQLGQVLKHLEWNIRTLEEVTLEKIQFILPQCIKDNETQPFVDLTTTSMRDFLKSHIPDLTKPGEREEHLLHIYAYFSYYLTPSHKGSARCALSEFMNWLYTQNYNYDIKPLNETQYTFLLTKYAENLSQDQAKSLWKGLEGHPGKIPDYPTK